MSGIRLEANTQIIMTLASQINTINQCVYRTGVDVNDLVFSILADAEFVLDKEQKELGVALVNIGASTTALAVFEEGNLLHATVLPIGSAHITNDLAIGLRTSIKTAEKVKVNEAHCLDVNIRKREEINLSNYDDDYEEGAKKIMVSKAEVVNITKARVEEIFDLVGKELKKIDRFGLLPAGIILTGGGSKLSGLVDHVKEQLRLPVFLAKTSKMNSIVDKINDLSYTNVLGLLKWGDENEGNRNLESIFSKIIKWIKNLIP